MRDTTDEAFIVTTGIATSTVAAVATVLAIDPGSTTPRREGLAATTLFPPSLAVARCRVGLQTSCMGVGAMLNPVTVRPLTKSTGQSYSKKDSIARLKRNKENIPEGKRHDSETKTRRQRARRARTALGLQPAPPHFS